MRNRSVLGLALMLGASGLVFGQANVAGKWTGEIAGGRGPQAVVLELTVSGTTVTGKITLGQGMPVDIANAKLDGNKLTFTATGGGGGRGGGGGGGGAAPAGGAPPAGGGGGGAPGGGGGGGGRGGGGGGGAQNYEATVNGAEMSVTRTPAAPAGGAPAAAAPPAGGAPAGGGGGGRGGGGPVTFTLKKG